jgi:phosphopantetheinyl transferase
MRVMTRSRIDHQVAVHLLAIDRCAVVLQESWKLLCEEERLRAAELVSGHVRDGFVVRRAAVRCVIAETCGVEPASVALQRRCEDCGAEGHGAPRALAPAGICVSTSHSSGWCAVAVSDRPVGIDIERSRAVAEAPNIATTMLGVASLARLQAAAGEERSHRFLVMWTRLEALGKLTGAGIAQRPSATHLPLVTGDCDVADDVRMATCEPVDGVVMSTASTYALHSVVISQLAAGRGRLRLEPREARGDLSLLH